MNTFTMSNDTYISKEVLAEIESGGLGSNVVDTEVDNILSHLYYDFCKNVMDLCSNDKKLKKVADWCSNTVGRNQAFYCAVVGAYNFVNAGFSLPDHKLNIAIYPKPNASVPAWACSVKYGGWLGPENAHETTSISINYNYLNKILQSGYSSVKYRNWSTTMSICHELCHYIHYNIEFPAQTSLKTKIKGENPTFVSGYADTNMCEYMAEVLSGAICGRKFPDAILKMLRNGNDIKDRKIRDAYNQLIENAKESNYKKIEPDYLTPFNFEDYKLTPNQKNKPTYKYHNKIKRWLNKYKISMPHTMAIDIYCNIINDRFDSFYEIPAILERKSTYQVGDFAVAPWLDTYGPPEEFVEIKKINKWKVDIPEYNVINSNYYKKVAKAWEYQLRKPQITPVRLKEQCGTEGKLHYEIPKHQAGLKVVSDTGLILPYKDVIKSKTIAPIYEINKF